MAGHSKWSNIKHKKQIKDIKKSKLFSKLANDIKNSFNKSTNDVENNLELKKVVDKALSKNMSKDIINNILSNNKIVGQEKIFYAATGNDGVYFIIECFDLNKNKIVGELRYLLNKYDLTLISFKSVDYLFFKYIKVKIFDKYNDKLIFDYICTNIFYDSYDNFFILTASEIKKIILLFKLFNINFDVTNYFYPKKSVNLLNEKIFKMKELIIKLKDYNYVTNIFYNFIL